MPSLKLTKAAVSKLPAPHPSGKQTLFWDTELKGFGVLVSGITTSKSFVVQHTLKDGKTRRMTIGPTNAINLEGNDGARERAKALIAQFYAGKDPKAEERTRRNEVERQAKGTLRAMLNEYVNKNQKLAANGKEYYRRMIERHLADWLDLPLRDITTEMVEDRHKEIAAEIAKRNPGSKLGGGPTTGHATANMCMHLFGIIWKWAAKPKRLPNLGQSPTWVLTDEKQWFEQARRARLVKADDLPAFYDAVDKLPNRTARDYLKLLLFTGLRRREAGSLRWADIDFAARLIRLPAERTKPGRKLDLPMSSFVRDLLVVRQRECKEEGSDFVFPANSRTGFLDDPSFALAQVAKVTGIQVCAHDLRRTFITTAEGSDISGMALKALVNHVLPENDVTAGYVQMTIDRLREPAQRVCDRLIELCQISAPEATNITRLSS